MWDDLTYMDVSNYYGFIIIANLFTLYHLSKLPRCPMSIGPCAFVLVIKAPNGIFGICSHCTNTSYCKYYNWHNQGLRESFRTAVKNWKFETDQCLLFLEIWNLKNVKLINACISGKDFLRNFPRIPIQTSYNGFSQKRYKMHTGRATHRDEKFQQIPWISIFLSLSVWWSRTIDTETFERFPLFCAFQSKLCKSLGVKYTSNTS